VAAAVVVGVSTSAQASSVSCPGALGNASDRQFQLDTTPGAVCASFGNGFGRLNVNNATADFDGDTWILLDSSEPTAGIDPFKNALSINGTGQLSGDFHIDAAVWGTYGRIILALQAKVANVNPDWAAFELTDGVITGDWSIEGSGLDHANLYGMKGVSASSDNDVSAVPEPTSIALLGAGLLFGARRLRRKK